MGGIELPALFAQEHISPQFWALGYCAALGFNYQKHQGRSLHCDLSLQSSNIKGPVPETSMPAKTEMVQEIGFEMSIDNESVSVDGEEVRENESVVSKPSIGRKETEGVLRWRFAVAVMLLITASTVIASTYKFLTRAENEEFLASVCFFRPLVNRLSHQGPRVSVSQNVVLVLCSTVL
jgi:hypothetical protein